MILVLAMVVPMSAMAQVDIHVSTALPPAVAFSAPPPAVVSSGTYVYGFPDAQEDIFFSDGWWWRPWEGRWYRSRHHNSGWAHYNHAPSFYSSIPPGWRNNYRDRHWQGHPWDYQQVPSDRLHHNWKSWKNDKHWEKKNNWGVKDMRFHSHSRKVQPQRVHPRQSRGEGQVRHPHPRQDQASREMRPQSHPQRELGHKHQGTPDRGGNEGNDRR